MLVDLDVHAVSATEEGSLDRPHLTSLTYNKQVGLVVVLYSLFLVAGILGRYRPVPLKRCLSAFGCVILRLGRGMPLAIMPVLTLMLVAFLHRAR